VTVIVSEKPAIYSDGSLQVLAILAKEEVEGMYEIYK
jgi:hypothetical protein